METPGARSLLTLVPRGMAAGEPGKTGQEAGGDLSPGLPPPPGERGGHPGIQLSAMREVFSRAFFLKISSAPDR
jgi:hypothetical protein